MGLFSSTNTRNVKKLEKIAILVENKEEEYKNKTDEQLKETTAVLKSRLEAGEGLMDILPDAYACVREASARVLGMRHFHVQILGGIALHQGRIAEMHTGEGKTLVATLPAYLNALTGKGVHVVTVNEYLATRDAMWMGKVHKFLGLSVGISKTGMTPEQKRAAYACDITYTTNNELGFDYLRDNLATRKEDRVLRPFNFAIIDEIDSILIDEARTPLIISGAGEKSSDGYISADKCVKSLRDSDFELDEKDKQIRLTDSGVAKVERFFGLSNYGDIENLELTHYINNALRANKIMKRDQNYIVKDGEVLIVDEFTGRLMVGRRYSNGLHQAVEAKEGVPIKNENRTLATITFQNLFRMYKKLSGMTGTAKTEEAEFNKIYALDVVTIPTNLPNIRKDSVDVAYTTQRGKLNAIIRDIKACHEKGQPVLVGTVNIDKSELISKLLKHEKIPHVVLNAKNHEKESAIVAQAGRQGAVTIATNMAGRGTDILLGGNPEFLAKQEMRKKGFSDEIIEEITAYKPEFSEEELVAKEEYDKLFEKFRAECSQEKEKVKALGGLKIIGTERHESRRIDNQLRGRAGRQGDPGESIFYLSFEDDLIRLWAGNRLQGIANLFHVGEDEPFKFKILARQTASAQKRIEGMHFSSRRQVLEYDEVMNRQRNIIYGERNKVLDGENVHEQVVKYFDDYIISVLMPVLNDSEEGKWNLARANEVLEDSSIFQKGTNFLTSENTNHKSNAEICMLVSEKVKEEYEKKCEFFKNNGIDFAQIERDVLLQRVDRNWIEHIDSMQILRNEIGLRAYGNKNPLEEYKRETFDMFEQMIEEIQNETAKMLIGIREIKVHGALPKQNTVNLSNLKTNDATAKGNVVADKKPGRNDPCPCGSGKKYKNCHGKNE